jgi:predicted transcriptional regulator
MKRTVRLPDNLAAALGREAQRLRVSGSHIAREALAARLGLASHDIRRISFAKLDASGEAHTARDAELILRREWRDTRGR